MARSIAVYRISDLEWIQNPPDDVNSPEFEAWYRSERTQPLFFDRLGSELAVREDWSEPAQQIGLKLIADFYEAGYRETDIKDSGEFSGSQLEELEQEIGKLEEFWRQNRSTSIYYSDLWECSGHLRQAIKIARENEGVVTIG